MNSHALVPLIATIAYIPLIITLLINRPWDARRRLFVLFIIPAVLWSVCDVLFRSDYMMEQKLFLVRTGITMGVWMGVQYYYLLRSFYSSDLVKRPYVYVLLIIIIVLALAGYMPRGVEQVPGGLNVQYGFATLGVVGALFVLGGKAIWKVWQKRKYSQDPIERNQLSYLFVGVILLIIFTSTVFFPGGGEYPMAHYGNLLNAALLTYVIIRHRLMDVRIMMRRFLVTATVYVIGIACWLLIILAIENLVGIGISMTRIVIFLGVAIPLIAFFNTVIHPLWGRWVERAFMGESYKSRGQLFDFIQQIYDVPTLEQFGSQLVYLIARSVGASRDCLFLPQQDIEETDFHARFSYPPVEENPIVKLVMNNDNPLVVWLKKEQRILHRNYIETIPELQSLWQTERDSIQLAEISMFVPLINRDELVAVLAIGSRTDGKIYNVEDIDLIESIANRVAASMEKEYLYERLEYQERELRLINELIRMINSSMNIQNIFKGFIHELSELVEVDGASIAFREEEMARIVALSVPGRSQWNLDQVVPIKDTSLEQVFSNKEMYYEPDLTRNQKYKAQEKHLQAGARSIVYLPMVVKGETTGCLVMANRKTNAYSSRQLALLERLAVQIAIPIENMRLYATAEQRARIDELTMLFNRRHFDEQFKAEMSRHARYNQALSLLMIDLDSFKTYNDIFGHPSGDKLLREIGELINSSIREGDQAFRYGGDEFVVLLPQTKMDDAFIVAERIRESVLNRMVTEEVTVRVSIGLASYPADGVLADEIVAMADTALYYAKSTGGNRTCLSSSILASETTVSGGNARVSSLSTVYALASAVDAKDHYTYGHSQKVRIYAVALAEAIGLRADAVSRISTAAVLHDIGKIGIPDKILNKEGGLNDEEWDAIKTHPGIGANIAGNVPSLAPCRNGILYHHEHWDGNGYPEGLKENNIPIDARILAVADAFAAMTSSRPYRAAIPDAEAIKILIKEKNTQFDPRLVDTFIEIVETAAPQEVQLVEDKVPNTTKMVEEDDSA